MESKELVGKLEGDVHIKAPPGLFYDVFCSRTHHIANVCPHHVQGVDIHEGEWGCQGSIVFWNYTYEGKKCVAKELVEVVDRENHKLIFKVLEGDLMEDYKNFRFIMEVFPQEEGGSVVHWTLEYEKLKGHSPDPHAMLQLDIDLTNDIDSHLIAQQDDAIQLQATSK